VLASTDVGGSAGEADGGGSRGSAEVRSRAIGERIKSSALRDSFMGVKAYYRHWTGSSTANAR